MLAGVSPLNMSEARLSFVETSFPAARLRDFVRELRSLDNVQEVRQLLRSVFSSPADTPVQQLPAQVCPARDRGGAGRAGGLQSLPARPEAARPAFVVAMLCGRGKWVSLGELDGLGEGSAAGTRLFRALRPLGVHGVALHQVVLGASRPAAGQVTQVSLRPSKDG